ncbi:MAG: CBS domain-containing protein [Firmicutes bacterium]|nr:CBS domain-containing protein [Bacillota bacterium]MDD4262906.1 CBS domain-containing protein [Bacillota bacterium]MDD4693051.1 CBS domain-containing protein [Bacillota bacterium]
MPQKISDIMTTDVVTGRMSETISEVAVKMAKNDIGFIPIVDGVNLVGVITDRDLVIRGYTREFEGTTPVSEVMTNRCITVSPETTVDEASNLMAEHQIRRLCIAENGRLIGVCAIGDLAIRGKYKEHAGRALSEISEQSSNESYMN